MTAIGFERHDHARCISGAMRTVDATCAAQGLHLTPVRRRAMEILLEEHRAVGAYHVLDKLRTEKLGSQPPVAYRALEFLVRNGFAHRVERLNAFVACAHPGEVHAPVFLICRSCDAVAEAHSHATAEAVQGAAAEIGFSVERMTIETLGQCPACTTEASA